MRLFLSLIFILFNALYAQGLEKCTAQECDFEKIYNSIPHCLYLNKTSFKPAEMNPFWIEQDSAKYYSLSVDKNAQKLILLGNDYHPLAKENTFINFNLYFSIYQGMYADTFAKEENGELTAEAIEKRFHFEDIFSIAASFTGEVQGSLSYRATQNKFIQALQSIENNFQAVMRFSEIQDSQEKKFHYNLLKCSQSILTSIE